MKRSPRDLNSPQNDISFDDVTALMSVLGIRKVFEFYLLITFLLIPALFFILQAGAAESTLTVHATLTAGSPRKCKKGHIDF